MHTCYTPWPVFRDVTDGLGLYTTLSDARLGGENTPDRRRSLAAHARDLCIKSWPEAGSSPEDHTRTVSLPEPDSFERVSFHGPPQRLGISATRIVLARRQGTQSKVQPVGDLTTCRGGLFIAS